MALGAEEVKNFSLTSVFIRLTPMIAYLQLPLQSLLIGRTEIFDQLRGIARLEIDTSRSAYLSLEPWMTVPRIRELYQALRHTYGAHIRFGCAEQKTTARAAALYRAVPHCSIITSSMTEAFLAELPIRLLPGLGERTTRYLEKQGVTTFAAFRNLSYQTLREWFGVSGLILQQFAHGIDPRPVEQRQRFALAV